jgi:hypothetical protein
MATQPKPPNNKPQQNTKPPQNTDIPETHWTQHANCKNQTNIMFPKRHKDITYIQQARQLCNNCPVKEPCLQYALQYPPADMHGVWAGKTSRQLAAEQKRLNITPTKPTISKSWNA